MSLLLSLSFRGREISRVEQGRARKYADRVRERGTFSFPVEIHRNSLFFTSAYSILQEDSNFQSVGSNFSFPFFWKREISNALKVIFLFLEKRNFQCSESNFFFWKREISNVLEVIFFFFLEMRDFQSFESNFSFPFFFKREISIALEIIFFF